MYEYASGDPVDLVDVDGHNPLLVLGAEVLSGAIWGAMVDIAIQLVQHGPRCIAWGQVWSAAKTGALFGALSGAFAAWNAPWFCLSGCFVAGTIVDGAGGERAIEEVALGDRIGPEGDECRTVSTEGWVELGLQIGSEERGAPGSVELRLLRTREWVEQRGARVGATIEVAIEELNIAGRARVTHVGEAPRLSEGARCPVTGTIRRSGIPVIAVTMAGGSALELTASHRVFSATRNGWVAAGELREGEELQTLSGTVRVRSVSAPSADVRTVFNLEVYARHEFFVGQEGVRAHNGYTDAAKIVAALRKQERGLFDKDNCLNCATSIQNALKRC